MKNEPLAYRMRPKTIDDVISQDHLVGPKAIIRRMVETKRSEEHTSELQSR